MTPMPENWLDLSHYGLRMRLMKAPTGRHYIVVTVAVAGGDFGKNEEDALARVRFVKSKKGSSMTADAPDARLAESLVNRVLDVLPRARRKAFAGDDFADMSDREKLREKLANKSRAIGRNRLGLMVFEDEEGKRFVAGDSGDVFEGAGAPENFLRSDGSRDSIVACAEGYLWQSFAERTQPPVDTAKFLAEIGVDPKTRGLTKLLGGIFRDAIDRLVAKRSGRPMQDVYMEVNRVNADSPAGADRTKVHPGLDIVVQRMAGIGGRFTEGSFLAEGGRYDSFLPSSVSRTDDRDQASVLVCDLVGEQRRFDDALKRIYTTMKSRRADGVTVFAMPVAKDEEEVAQMDALRHRLALEFEFETEGTIAADLSGRGVPMTVISLGGRRASTHDAVMAPLPRQVDDFGTLWNLAAETVGVRARVSEEAVLAIGDTLAEGKGRRTAIQSPYRPASQIGTPTKMVPVNMETASQYALGMLKERKGDVDAYVAREFGYKVEELGEIFSPEQIDALGLHAFAEERGRAFLVGDEMGVGKGRTLAAIMRRKALNGQKVVFMTERERNLSDIWRDIVATRSHDILKPFIMNKDVRILDPHTNDVLLTSPPQEEAEAVFASKGWPQGYGLVLGTYGQVNKNIDLNTPDRLRNRKLYRKAEWFREIMDTDTVLTLDECHNAAGESNVSANIRAAMDKCQLRENVVFSSATFAPDAKRMEFYAYLFPDNLSVGELSVMLKQGGEPFQEVISDMLVRDGVMVRREFDRASVEVRQVLDESRISRNRAMADMMAPILSEVTQLSGLIDQILQQANRARGVGRKDNFFVTRSGFGSPLHTVSRLFIAALKVEESAAQAIEALRNGGKPVFLVENTLQQLMEELVGAQSDEDEAAVGVTMNDVLRKVLSRTVTIKQKIDDRDEFKDLREASPEIAALYARVAERIDAFPHLSVAIIDDLRSHLEDAGFVCDEITGRTIRLEDGQFVRRVPGDVTQTKNDFNRGLIDGLVINPSGATGIDLHSSVTFKDQRRRFFIEVQAPADIVKGMQARGRVMRHDQVVEPCFVKVGTGLPAEMRINAMENSKLRSMSANTTSNRDSDHLNRNIPDLINPVGDAVCSRYAEQHPDLVRRLGFEVGAIEVFAQENLGTDLAVADRFNTLLNGKAGEGIVGRQQQIEPTRVVDTRRTASEFLSRIIMLPVDEQTRIFDELTAEFRATVEEMEARGEAPLRSFDLPGKVHVKDRTIYQGSGVDDPDSVFNEPLYAIEGAVERTEKSIGSDALVSLIEMGEMSSGRRQPCIDMLKGSADEFLRPYLPANVANVADAIKAGVKIVMEKKDRLDRLATALSKISCGSQVEFAFGEEKKTGIVTRIEYPPRGREHLASCYGIEYVIAGDTQARRITLDTFFRDPEFQIREGLEGAGYEKILKSYDVSAQIKLHNVTILTGNIFKAMKINVAHRMGRLSMFRTVDGRVDRGIVCGAKRSFTNVPVEISDAAMAVDALLKGRFDLNGANSQKDRSLLFAAPAAGFVTMKFPKQESKRYAAFWDIPLVQRHFEQSTSDGKERFVQLKVDEVSVLITALYANGVPLYAPPTARNFALAYYDAQLGNGTNDRPASRALTANAA